MRLPKSATTIYPLANALRDFKGRRIHPVSQVLCDDVVRRLEPSLQKHRNCDLLDIFPGAGLLSTRLHKALEPRRHILLEPEMKKYKQFLTPLLEPSNTPYHHVPLNPYDMQTYSRLFDDGHLPEQSRASEVDGLNNSLFILANFTQNQPEGFSRGFLFMRFLESYLDKTLFNRYGFVRILGLVPASESDVILPKHVRGRRRTSLLAECVSKELAEVASSTDHYEIAATRGYDITMQSQKAALARQKESGVYSPDDRAIGPFPMAPKIHKHGESFPPRVKRDWHNEFEELHDKATHNRLKKPARGGRTDNPQHEEYVKHRKMKARFANETRSEIYANERVKQEEQILSLENSVIEMLRNPKKSLKQVHAGLDAIEKKRNEMIGAMARVKAAGIRYEILSEELAAYRNVHSPAQQPLLLWDLRPYEPMMIGADEVCPEESQIAFLDLQPNPDSPVMRTRREQEKTGDLEPYQALVRAYSHLLGVYSLKGLTPIGDIISRLFPGRSMVSVLEAVPGLKPYAVKKVFEPMSARDRARAVLKKQRAQSDEDAKRELDSYSDNCLNYTVLRHLSAEVIWDLTVEWFFWPGREPGTEIARIVGGGLSELVPETLD